MIIHYIIYLSTVAFGAISLTVFYFMLRKSTEKLPDTWRKSLPSNNFKISILFLLIYLLIILFGEIIAYSLASHGIYNSFVISINFTLFTPFLFGFLFLNTQTIWKRYCYVILYIILVSYLITGGYYHPKCNLSSVSSLVFSSTCFLGGLLHLTDLLVNPKSEHFKLQLKICVCILTFNTLSSVMTSFHWADTKPEPYYSDLIFYIHIYNCVIYYFSLGFISTAEILKLRHAL